jgi:hypothetical protein
MSLKSEYLRLKASPPIRSVDMPQWKKSLYGAAFFVVSGAILTGLVSVIDTVSRQKPIEKTRVAWVDQQERNKLGENVRKLHKFVVENGGKFETAEGDLYELFTGDYGIDAIVSDTDSLILFNQNEMFSFEDYGLDGFHMGTRDNVFHNGDSWCGIESSVGLVGDRDTDSITMNDALRRANHYLDDVVSYLNL